MILVASLLCGCAAGLPIVKSTRLSPGGEGVQLVEAGEVPGGCEELEPVEVRRGTLQHEDTLAIKARNKVAGLGGNLFEVIERAMVRLEGKAFRCPEELVAAIAPVTASDEPEPAATGAVAPPPEPVAESSAKAVTPPPPPPATGPGDGASGQAGEDSLDGQARELFERGREAFDGARYEEALKYFRAAHQLSGRYALLYNIGQAADRLRRDAEALTAFEAFLEQAPAGDRRNEVAVRVKVLRRVVKTR